MAVSDFDYFGIISAVYQLIQIIISWAFSPLPPQDHEQQKPLGRVAIIGAGITGISSAAHLIGAGFEVTIFDDAETIGGIWSKVNKTSGLQISSLMYRWFPAVKYTRGYPRRDEILENVKNIWKLYQLDQRTRLKTRVKSVTRHQSSTDPAKGGHSRWVINGDQSEVYDGLVVATGTCGKPKMIDLPNQEKFMGKIVHSSHLDGVELKNKNVLIVGGGASGIEALELAVAKGAKKPTILARSDKWIIPRLTLVDVALSLNPLGRETFLSKIPEFLLAKLHYRDLEEKMAPTGPFYAGTPIVNSSALQDIREGKADYLRGDVLELTSKSIRFNKRTRGTKPESKGREMNLDADVIVIATGFDVPSLDFLPKDLFPEDYQRPNLYLHHFSVKDTSVVCTNAAFVGAVGTVGHVHIGVYARILAMFLLEPSTRPSTKDARLWVDFIRWFKANAPGGALSHFSYMEMCIWMVSFPFFRPSRLPYLFFCLFGLGYWHVEGPQDKAVFHWSVTKLIPHFRAKSSRIRKQRIGGPDAVKVNGA
ncbi:FAD/NAD(P)-binding domain-containing protein [Jaminaea rosea]|uniref:FAD/NAD(P)-binding domain-containing protein n=1 Tax=Jaminaea rosea TaxID=1569628 RepID=A0A316UXQ8_9BASI|nr:FAD/NAD(P)-binding domain-containing protein [Jaminaea rosea]PWN29568.1 FAD/NAD(P)-binding domain-containing protein [Jaminaea rosea]